MRIKDCSRHKSGAAKIWQQDSGWRAERKRRDARHSCLGWWAPCHWHVIVIDARQGALCQHGLAWQNQGPGRYGNSLGPSRGNSLPLTRLLSYSRHKRRNKELIDRPGGQQAMEQEEEMAAVKAAAISQRGNRRRHTQMRVDCGGRAGRMKKDEQGWAQDQDPQPSRSAASGLSHLAFRLSLFYASCERSFETTAIPGDHA
ncbi:hypothetical protein ANO11243_083950 [Dothideomycetidae sp. 11243]|nr:hypothetical protein ANO11243_083950 [fungal sp. No.11243]